MSQGLNLNVRKGCRQGAAWLRGRYGAAQNLIA